MNLKKLINEQIILPFLERRNLWQLFNNTPRKIKQRARNDITAKLLTISNKGKYQYETTTGSNGHIHRQYIIPILPKKNKSGKIFNLKPNLSSSIIVWCDCKYFKYTLEYSLHKNEASRIINSNGQPAAIRNPQDKTYLCKHLQKCIPDYIERVKSLYVK